MSDHTIMIIWVMKIFFVQFSVYSYHLLTSSASVRSIPFLSFIETIFVYDFLHFFLEAYNIVLM